MSHTANKASSSRGPRLTSEGRTAIGIAAAVVVIVAGGIALYFSNRVDPVPRLDAPVEHIARFVGGPEFAKLPFERQKVYMEALDNREDELDQAYRDAKLIAPDYKRALEYAWFGKHLPRMEKFLALPAHERPEYIEERLDKKEEKDRKKKGPKPAAEQVSLSGASPLPPIDVERDEQAEKDIPRTWPDDWRKKWKQYRDALKERRNAREEAREELRDEPKQRPDARVSTGIEARE
jgi:hypothetical protein